jgi:hypothetical protein
MPTFRPTLVACTAVAVLVAMAQPAAAGSSPAFMWSRVVASEATDVAASPTGGAFVVGRKIGAGPHGESGAVVRRYGSGGDLMWARTWIQPKGYAFLADVTVASDGSVYAAGELGSSRTEGGGILLLKYTPAGHLVWTRLSPGWLQSKAEYASGVAVIGDVVAISGAHHGCCGDPTRDSWVRAYDSGDGHWLWSRDVEVPGIDDATNDDVHAVAAGPGGFFAAGEVARGPEPLDTELADHDVFIQKITTTGAVVWTRTVSDPKKDEDRAVDVVSNGGRILVAAYMDEHRVAGSPGVHLGHGWLRSYESDGDTAWTQTWGFQPSERPGGLGVAPGGGVVVAGTRRDPADHLTNLALRGYDAAGALQWSTAQDVPHRSLSGNGTAWAGAGLYAAATRSGAEGLNERGLLERFIA